jgi:hypothetical protein
MTATPPPGSAPAAVIEVRPVGAESFDEIYPLLQRFPTKRMTRDDWRWMLFGYPWSDATTRGHALYADGKAVGFIGTVLAQRPLLGRVEKFCNPTSWIVLEPFRYAASLLLRPVLRMRDHTIVNLTPSPAAYTIFKRLGLVPLESEQVVLPPVPDPLQVGAALHGSFTLAPDALRSELEGDDLRAYQDLASSPAARHVLLRRGARRCYLVATLGRKRGIPYADVQYLGDRAFFWEHRLLAQTALVRVMGVAGLAVAVDARFLLGRAPRLALRWKARRLYRPSREDVTPTMIDGLYSELMGIRY